MRVQFKENLFILASKTSTFHDVSFKRLLTFMQNFHLIFNNRWYNQSTISVLHLVGFVPYVTKLSFFDYVDQKMLLIKLSHILQLWKRLKTLQSHMLDKTMHLALLSTPYPLAWRGNRVLPSTVKLMFGTQNTYFWIFLKVL